jgi:hypothetical protein
MRQFEAARRQALLSAQHEPDGFPVALPAVRYRQVAHLRVARPRPRDRVAPRHRSPVRARRDMPRLHGLAGAPAVDGVSTLQTPARRRAPGTCCRSARWCVTIHRKSLSSPVSGKRFERLTVVSGEIVTDPDGRPALECSCDCGATILVRRSQLTAGRKRSCGCLRSDTNTTHGQTGSREYRSWCSVIQRCTNPLSNSWSRYGGRGITVCATWAASFERFLADMGPRPPGTTLDRKDNSLGYEKSNCRWATPKEQQRNMRSNRWLTLNQLTLTIAEWAERTGLDDCVIRSRVRRGWPVERALTESAKFSRKKHISEHVPVARAVDQRGRI